MNDLYKRINRLTLLILLGLSAFPRVSTMLAWNETSFTSILLIMVECLVMSAMSKDKDKLVVLQVDVPLNFRKRFRMQALKLGITMGDLLIQLTEQGLKKLEDEDK